MSALLPLLQLFHKAMSISRQIGWSDKEKLLYDIYNQLRRANGLAYKWTQGDFFHVSFNPYTSQLDISNLGLLSSDIDAYLIYHADVLGTNNIEMDIRGNSNPTATSADARQTLFDNFVLVNYNEDFIP